MRSQNGWYCAKGHFWIHDTPNATLFGDPDECPTCQEKEVHGPFWDAYQAEFVYLKRLDNKRLGE